jgi:para-aminobenzoate synthetase component 1
MRFSVAIRTMTLFDDGRAVFNVGGGIVFDSVAEAEYDECLLKSKFAVGDRLLRG